MAKLWWEVSTRHGNFDTIGNGIHTMDVCVISWTDRTMSYIVAPAWRYLPTLVVYRVVQSLRRVNQCVIIILDIWGLAEWDIATVPSWWSVKAVKWVHNVIRKQ